MTRVAADKATHIISSQTNYYYTKGRTNFLSFKDIDSLPTAVELHQASPRDIEFHQFKEDPHSTRWGSLLYKINPDKTCTLICMNVDSSG